jgi:hypothetical protein
MTLASGAFVAYRYRLYWTHPGISTNAAMKAWKNGKTLPDFLIDYDIRHNQLSNSMALHARYLVKKYIGGIKLEQKTGRQVLAPGDNNPGPLQDLIKNWPAVLKGKVNKMGLLLGGPEHNSVERAWEAAIARKKSENLPLGEGFPRTRKNRKRWSYAIQPGTDTYTDELFIQGKHRFCSLGPAIRPGDSGFKSTPNSSRDKRELRQMQHWFVVMRGSNNVQGKNGKKREPGEFDTYVGIGEKQASFAVLLHRPLPKGLKVTEIVISGDDLGKQYVSFVCEQRVSEIEPFADTGISATLNMLPKVLPYPGRNNLCVIGKLIVGGTTEPLLVDLAPTPKGYQPVSDLCLHIGRGNKSARKINGVAIPFTEDLAGVEEIKRRRQGYKDNIKNFLLKQRQAPKRMEFFGMAALEQHINKLGNVSDYARSQFVQDKAIALQADHIFTRVRNRITHEWLRVSQEIARRLQAANVDVLNARFQEAKIELTDAYAISSRQFETLLHLALEKKNIQFFANVPRLDAKNRFAKKATASSG